MVELVVEADVVANRLVQDEAGRLFVDHITAGIVLIGGGDGRHFIPFTRPDAEHGPRLVAITHRLGLEHPHLAHGAATLRGKVQGCQVGHIAGKDLGAVDLGQLAQLRISLDMDIAGGRDAVGVAAAGHGWISDGFPQVVHLVVGLQRRERGDIIAVTTPEGIDHQQLGGRHDLEGRLLHLQHVVFEPFRLVGPGHA
ncbi:hypothetical protein D3C79_574990 [compost metagenome]